MNDTSQTELFFAKRAKLEFFPKLVGKKNKHAKTNESNIPKRIQTQREKKHIPCYNFLTWTTYLLFLFGAAAAATLSRYEIFDMFKYNQVQKEQMLELKFSVAISTRRDIHYFVIVAPKKRVA